MRYFIEVSYKGTHYAGFQIQKNANSIQGELERALSLVTRTTVILTGASRTDAGVHALQNFFHFDFHENFPAKLIYNLNALLPLDIVVKSVFPVSGTMHCRFSASSREYRYYITTIKDPFNSTTAWYYPYSVNLQLLQQAANILYNYTNYTSFAKRNSNVFTHNCTIANSEWIAENTTLTYHIKANRFLRGMVRGLVGTMLLVGRNRITIKDFEDIINFNDSTKANFATPPHGLFLVKVEYPGKLDID